MKRTGHHSTSNPYAYSSSDLEAHENDTTRLQSLFTHLSASKSKNFSGKRSKYQKFSNMKKILSWVISKIAYLFHPFIFGILSLAILSLCVILRIQGHHQTDTGRKFPFLSETAFYAPEKWIFLSTGVIGFCYLSLAVFMFSKLRSRESENYASIEQMLTVNELPSEKDLISDITSIENSTCISFKDMRILCEYHGNMRHSSSTMLQLAAASFLLLVIFDIEYGSSAHTFFSLEFFIFMYVHMLLETSLTRGTIHILKLIHIILVAKMIQHQTILYDQDIRNRYSAKPSQMEYSEETDMSDLDWGEEDPDDLVRTTSQTGLLQNADSLPPQYKESEMEKLARIDDLTEKYKEVKRNFEANKKTLHLRLVDGTPNLRHRITTPLHTTHNSEPMMDIVLTSVGAHGWDEINLESREELNDINNSLNQYERENEELDPYELGYPMDRLNVIPSDNNSQPPAYSPNNNISIDSETGSDDFEYIDLMQDSNPFFKSPINNTKISSSHESDNARIHNQILRAIKVINWVWKMRSILCVFVILTSPICGWLMGVLIYASHDLSLWTSLPVWDVAAIFQYTNLIIILTFIMTYGMDVKYYRWLLELSIKTKKVLKNIKKNRIL